ncbi:unnamed protein product, partial [marine sediment metagenome]
MAVSEVWSAYKKGGGVNKPQREERKKEVKEF